MRWSATSRLPFRGGQRSRSQPGALGEAFELDASDDASVTFKEAFRIAYGTTTVEMGVGGSIPFVAAFEEAYPEASILLTGVMDPTSQIHAPNESQSLSDLESGILGEAIALQDARRLTARATAAVPSHHGSPLRRRSLLSSP